jgi:ABC-type iron transport system FetAB permease component
MAKSKKERMDDGALVAIQPTTEVTVLPPQSGMMGNFLDNIRNTFKARAMRMNGLVKRVDETGQRMEAMLRAAAERAEAAESALEQNLLKEGLLPEISSEDEVEE